MSSGPTLVIGGTTLSSATDLASFFECPVCFDYVLPPILQCPSGHLVNQKYFNMLTLKVIIVLLFRLAPTVDQSYHAAQHVEDH